MRRTCSLRRSLGIYTAVILILAVSGMFVGCPEPVIVQVVESPAIEVEPEPEPIPEPEPEPVWTPEVGHVYILDAADAIVSDLTPGDWEGAYADLLSAVAVTCEVHNRDYPQDPWYYVGGGAE